MKLKKDAIKLQSLKENANLRTTQTNLTGQHQLRSGGEELKSTSDIRIKTEKIQFCLE